MIEKRWLMSVDGGVTYPTEVFPIDASKFTFSDENNLSRGQIFFRRKLNQKMMFKGDDYKFFWQRRQSGSTCTRIFIRQDRKRGAAWNTFWIGSFAPSAGDFDHENCTFQVKPRVEDQYTCLLSKESEKVNILRLGPVGGNIVVSPTIEWGGAVAGVIPSGCEHLYGNVDLIGGDLSMPTNGWGIAHSVSIFGGTAQQIIYWREHLNTICVDGVPAEPPGGGWTLLNDTCSSNGMAEWVRVPTITYAYGDPISGTCSNGVSVPPNDACEWTLVLDCPSEDCDPYQPEYGPLYICYVPVVAEMNHGRYLESVVDFILDEIGCPVERIRSDFFEWDPVGNAPDYYPGQNYVTLRPNQIDNLLIVQKSDVIDPNASNPATIGELSFAELMTMLFTMFRVLWDIDEDGNLRIEHVKFWTSPVGLDLYSGPYAGMDEGRAVFQALNERIKRIERLKFEEASGLDFIGADIIYDSGCAASDGEGQTDKESVEEYSPGSVTTDVQFILTDPDEISKSGFVLLATEWLGLAYYSIVDVGALSGNTIANAPLSTANLQRDYWTWDRKLKRGNMNREDMVFDGAEPNLQQMPVVLEALCYKAWDMDPKKSVRTTLGVKYLGGANGLIRKRLWIDAEDTLTLTLVYSF